MTDIVDKLSKYVAGMGTRDLSQYTAFATAEEIGEAIDEIEKLRKQKQDLIFWFRTNMMYHAKEYSHQEFDAKLKEILDEIEI